jgi:hypothetical protein
MFGFGKSRSSARPAPASARRPAPAQGHRLPPRSGVLGEDSFPWEDDVLVLAAQARKEQRPANLPSVVLEPSIAIAALSVYGVEVLDLAS